MSTFGRNTLARILTIALLLSMLAACSGDDGGSQQEDGLPASTFVVDESIEPAYDALPGFSDGRDRPVAALVDEDGNQAEFVENEILVVTDDSEALEGIMQRWSGEVIHEIDVSGTALVDLPTHYLVRVDTNGAPTDELPELTREIHPQRRNDLRVSSERGLGLLAIGAREQSQGIDIGLSWVGRTTSIIDRETREAPTGDNVGGISYDPNAFNWPTHSTEGSQRFGTAEAWRHLTIARRTDNKVKVGILDQGFLNPTSSPTGLSNQTTYHANAPFVDPFRTSADDIGHGAKVASAAIALPDDGFGGAGSAGPVGEGVNVYTSYDMTSSISALALARRHGAQIANMSYSTKVPATLSWAALPLERATRTLRRSGMLLFAAAGNDNQNIDAKRCVIRICWEKTWYSPCENDGVICVGGLMWNSDFKATGSNYGGEHLDISGPYSILLGPDPTQPTNDASVKYGTSYASPYVAGVAALIWAADPGLSAGEVRDILYSTSRDSADDDVDRVVNALDAVTVALGDGTPPYVEITSPSHGASFSRGSESIPLSARIEDLDDDVVSVSWESDLDGQIAMGSSTAVTDLSEGLHEITVRVTDSTGLRAEDSRTISVDDEAPIVNILSPEYGEEFYQSQSIVLRATTYDPTTASPVRDESVQWYIDGDDRPLAQGHSTSVAGGTFAASVHRIKVVASDGNTTGEATVDFTVYADPAGNIEPTAVIDSPEADELFLADKMDDSTNRNYATVVLCGHGEDPEDGTLEGDSVTWYYRKSGESIWYPAGNDPGPGLCLNHRLYLEGNHTDYQLRLRVEDSDGTTDSATISVAVYTLT